MWLAGTTGTLFAIAVGAGLSLLAGGIAFGGLLIALGATWWHAACRSSHSVSVFDHAAAKLELTCCKR
jgi:hypothetical protein